MTPYERAALISFVVGAICLLVLTASRIAYPRITPLREKIDPPLPEDWLTDRRSAEQRVREAGK